MPRTRSPEVGTFGRVSFKITVAAVLSVVTVAAVLLYHYLPARRDEIAFATAVIGGAATVYAAYYAAWTLRISVARDMQAKSFDILASLNEHESAKLRVFIEKEIQHRDFTPAQFYRRIVDDAGCLSVVTAVLGLYEDMAIAIQESYVDERTLYRSLSFLAPWTFENLRNYVMEERRITGDHNLYAELEKLSNAWRSGTYLASGSSIPVDVLDRPTLSIGQQPVLPRTLLRPN